VGVAVIDAEAQAQIVQDDVFTRQIKRINIMLLIVLAALVLGPAFAGWWVARQLPVVSLVEIDNMQTVGNTALCPGEKLIITYDFHAKGAGVLVRDWTTWSMEPPRTMIYSEWRRFILDGPIDQHLTETWHIPLTYLDYETEQAVPLPPGQYRRYLAVSSPSRSTVVAITSVSFSIREDCP
jgi:hypothetical protein